MIRNLLVFAPNEPVTLHAFLETLSKQAHLWTRALFEETGEVEGIDEGQASPWCGAACGVKFRLVMKFGGKPAL